MNRLPENIYFIGIGGIGMSALARYFKSQGCRVAGYDRTETTLTRELEEEGMLIHYEDQVDLIPEWAQHGNNENCWLIYTPAIPTDHKELNYFRNKGRTLYKRAEVLGLLTRNRFNIAIAGTHGKTTTSTLVAHLLRYAERPMAAFMGGISVNYHTNYITWKVSPEATVVTEADEYDRSFLHLNPDVAVINSMDPDHLDIYGKADALRESFNAFGSKVKPGGKLLVKEGLPIGLDHISYSVQPGSTASYRAENIAVTGDKFWFDFISPKGVLKHIHLGIPGLHNIENAVAASAAVLEAGYPLQLLAEGLASYQGVKRRFEYLVKQAGKIYIDDYAHHPAELTACITAVKSLYPGKRITGIFQPHLFSRTRDFAAGFSESLSLLDEVILLDIYPARELPIPGINSEMLLSAISSRYKEICTKQEVLGLLRELKPEVLLTLGAGDIDTLVEPIKNWMEQR